MFSHLSITRACAEWLQTVAPTLYTKSSPNIARESFRAGVAWALKEMEDEGHRPHQKLDPFVIASAHNLPMEGEMWVVGMYRKPTL